MDVGRSKIFKNVREIVEDDVGQHVVDGHMLVKKETRWAVDVNPYTFHMELTKDGEPVDVSVMMVPPKGVIRVYIPEKLIKDQLLEPVGQTQVWSINPAMEGDPILKVIGSLPDENGNIILRFGTGMEDVSKYLERVLFGAIDASDMAVGKEALMNTTKEELEALKKALNMPDDNQEEEAQKEGPGMERPRKRPRNQEEAQKEGPGMETENQEEGPDNQDGGAILVDGPEVHVVDGHEVHVVDGHEVHVVEGHEVHVVEGHEVHVVPDA